MDKDVENVINVSGVHYCVYRDKGYNYRPFLEIQLLG